MLIFFRFVRYWECELLVLYRDCPTGGYGCGGEGLSELSMLMGLGTHRRDDRGSGA